MNPRQAAEAAGQREWPRDPRPSPALGIEISNRSLRCAREPGCLLGRRRRGVLCPCSGGFDGASRNRIRRAKPLQFGGRTTATAGAIFLKSGWRLHAAIPARRPGFLRWEWQLGAKPTSVRGRPKGRRKNSKHRTDRHSRRRNADRFLSPFRFALRMSRRTEVGSRGHSISRARPAKIFASICREMDTPGSPARINRNL